MKNNYLSYLLLGLQNPALLIALSGKVHQCNQPFLDLYNQSASAFIDKNYFEVCNKYKITPALDFHQTRVEYSKTSITCISHHSSVLKTIHWTASLIRDDKNVETIFLIGFDISEVINASTKEKEIKRSIIDYIPNYFVFWKDINSVYLGCNEALAKVMGLKSSRDIIGKTDYDLPTTKDQSDAYCKDDKEVMTSKIPKLNIEEPQTLPDGSEGVLLTSKMPLIDEIGNVYGILGIYSDITERKKMEIALKKAKKRAESASQAKTSFIANMSHDIRTPLTGIVGMADLLGENLQNPEHQQYAHWIHEAGEQLLNMLNGILEVVSADDIKETELHNESFDLYQFVQDLVQLELPSTQLKGIELRVDLDESIPQFIVSDRTKLHRILLNLLGNAIKFTQEGSVTIKLKCLSCTKKQVDIQFCVVDTGIGIPLAVQEKVFDRFFRASPSYKGIYAGHGIGLHIAQAYARLLGGEVSLLSHEGAGTSFYFTLPCKVGRSKATASPTPLVGLHKVIAIKPIEAKKTPHLLLIEDNIVARRLIESNAIKAGYHYTSAVDGEQALTLAQSQTFDLIITDLGLPGISGQEFAHRIREWEKSIHKNPVPIVGLSAHMKANNESLLSDMNGVFTKPVNLKMLQLIVSQFVLTMRGEPTHPDKPCRIQGMSQLGIDLPATEAELFELDKFPLFNLQNAIESMGNEWMISKILLVMVNQEIPTVCLALEKAYAKKNWTSIEKLAHKMKGGAVYCGTIRLQYACQYIEQYRKAGHKEALNALYQQLIHTIQETKQHIQQWLYDNAR